MATPTAEDRAYHAKRALRANEHSRARARKYGVAYGPVDALAVYDADDWQCWICGRDIDPAGRYEQLPEQHNTGPHSHRWHLVDGRDEPISCLRNPCVTRGGVQPEGNLWLPSLDHVVQLWRGGTHTMDNLRASHATCNWQRSGLGPAPRPA